MYYLRSQISPSFSDLLFHLDISLGLEVFQGSYKVSIVVEKKSLEVYF